VKERTPIAKGQRKERKSYGRNENRRWRKQCWLTIKKNLEVLTFYPF
jgi:hypothetical protein